MSIKCSEVVNYNLSICYYWIISEIFDEEVKYIHGYKSLVNEYFKKVLNLRMSSGIKLGKNQKNLPMQLGWFLPQF